VRSEYPSAALARPLGADLPDVSAPGWADDLIASRIAIALFAPDLAQWPRSQPSFVGSQRVSRDET
jgi:hypothetical protein